MKIEAIEQLSIPASPPLGKYHEAIKILLDGGVGTKVRVTEESKWLAQRAKKLIYSHLYLRGMSTRSRILENICEIERVS